MKYKKILTKYNANRDLFDQILVDFKDDIKYVDNFDEFIYGSYQKDKIIVSRDKSNMIIQEILFNHEAKLPMEGVSTWKQCWIVRSLDESLELVNADVTGTYAYNFMIRMLSKYYTWDEIVECLNSHSDPEDDILKQQHYLTNVDDKAVYRFDNCFEYDVNSAHGSALAEIFPKAADEIRKMYIERKINPNNKKFFNYFVGMLGSKRKNGGKFRGTYNWIVHRTTKLLETHLNKTFGRLVYINTDGYVVQNPGNVIPNSKTLGEFKIEYQGPVYVARTRHYTIMQLGNTLKGTCPAKLRDNIDLSKGQLIEYDDRDKAVNDGVFQIITREVNNG